jgi:hypothetical protein
MVSFLSGFLFFHCLVKSSWSESFDWGHINSFFDSIYACSNLNHFDIQIVGAGQILPGIWRPIIPHIITCLKHTQPQDSVPGFVESFLQLQNEGGVYQFGIFKGESMLQLRNIYGPDVNMYGFDSFKGLPDIVEVGSSHWHAGEFKSTDGMGEFKSNDNETSSAIDEALIIDAFKKQLIAKLGGKNPVVLIDGYYNESLRDADAVVSRHRLPPARYIDIDVDLYTSSMEALSFMVETGLLRPGTLIGYDDYWSNFCRLTGDVQQTEAWTSTAWTSPPSFYGEMKAHKEISEKYGIVFKCVGGSCLIPPISSMSFLGIPHANFSAHQLWGPVYVAVSINNSDVYDAGMMRSKLDYLTWMETNTRCQEVKTIAETAKLQGNDV